MTRPVVVGLTGGVASGKSSVSALLGKLGADIVDTDIIAREVVASGSEGLRAVVVEFGEALLTSTGELDRRRMRELVFADGAVKQRLEALLHPLIGAEARRRVESADGDYVVLVVPLLVESGTYGWVDRVLVVDATTELQQRLLKRRDDIGSELALRMIHAQASRLERLQQADDVIRNSAGLADLALQVACVDRRYRALSARRSCAHKSQ